MSTTQPFLRCHYRYDPLDRLISHTRPATPAHQRFYCKSRLATEIQGAVQHSIFQHDDRLLAQQQCQGEEVSAILLSTDLQRSVLDTFQKNQQRQSIAYSPYGYRHADYGLTSLLGFSGEQPDPGTGHYLLGNGYRAFIPVLMRFNSPDSLSPFGEGGLNPYAYCQGDPVNERDPTGHAISLRWAFLRDNVKRIVQTRSETNLLPKSRTNGNWELDNNPPVNRPVAKVEPLRQSTSVSSEQPALNAMNIHPRRVLAHSNEFSRFIDTSLRSSDPSARANPAMRTAMRNAAEPRVTTGIIPTLIEDTARLTEMTVYANMRGIGVTSYPRAIQLANQSRRMFEIRRRDQNRMEAHPLLGGSPN